MIFVLKMLFTFFYDRKNENHSSLLIIRYSLLITHYILRIQINPARCARLVRTKKSAGVCIPSIMSNE